MMGQKFWDGPPLRTGIEYSPYDEQIDILFQDDEMAYDLVKDCKNSR